MIQKQNAASCVPNRKGALFQRLCFRDYEWCLVEDFLCAANHFSTALPGFLACPLGANPNFPRNVFSSVPCPADYISATAVSSTGDSAPPITSYRNGLSAYRRRVRRRKGRTNERDRHQHRGGEKYSNNFFHANTSCSFLIFAES